LAVLPVLATIVVTQRRAELTRTGIALWNADPRWVTVGVGLELSSVAVAALIYRLLLRRLGYLLSGFALASAHLQRCAAGAVSPLSGPTSVYVFLQFLHRNRVPAHDGLLTVGVRAVVGQVASVLTIFVGLVLMRPSAALQIGGGILLIAVIGVVTVRQHPGRVSQWSLELGRRHLPSRATEWGKRLVAHVRLHRLSARDFAWPIVLTLLTRAGTVALLVASLNSVGADASIGTAVVAYFASLLAHAALPAFGGAGLIEGATVAALIHQGVPADLALVAALLWRMIDFWLPVGLGLIAHAGVILGPILARRPLARSAKAIHRPAPPALPARAKSAVALSPVVVRAEPRRPR
jgi:uncharacterized protein (TIRG00374 family)